MIVETEKVKIDNSQLNRYERIHAFLDIALRSIDNRNHIYKDIYIVMIGSENHCPLFPAQIEGVRNAIIRKYQVFTNKITTDAIYIQGNDGKMNKILIYKLRFAQPKKINIQYIFNYINTIHTSSCIVLSPEQYNELHRIMLEYQLFTTIDTKNELCIYEINISIELLRLALYLLIPTALVGAISLAYYYNK